MQCWNSIQQKAKHFCESKYPSPWHNGTLIRTHKPTLGRSQADLSISLYFHIHNHFSSIGEGALFLGEKLIPQGSLLSLEHHFVRSQSNLFCSSKWKKSPVYEIIFEYLMSLLSPSAMRWALGFQDKVLLYLHCLNCFSFGIVPDRQLTATIIRVIFRQVDY